MCDVNQRPHKIQKSDKEQRSFSAWRAVYDNRYEDDTFDSSDVEWRSELRAHIMAGKVHPKVEEVRNADSGTCIACC
jgi:hypothetical protein